jgi:Uma2 family endonuclease
MARNRGKLTYDDYAAIPEDRQRHEIIDGEHWVNPAPTTRHQRVLLRLARRLAGQFETTDAGEVFVSPIDVQLSEHDIVQPDLVVILAARASIITETRILGVPDLVIEVLSPATSRHDRERKKPLYERAGVPEYWIVDPDARVLEQWVLDAGRYRLAGEHREQVRFAGPAGIVVDLNRVW